MSQLTLCKKIKYYKFEKRKIMNIDIDCPLISCICVTSNRTEMLLKSIISFSQQTYPNKELVISYPENDEPTKKLLDYIANNTDLPILRVDRDEKCSIGKARNLAIEYSNGKYICIWDDDDIHFENRLTEQYDALNFQGQSYRASTIAQILLFQCFNQTAYLSFASLWSCTLLCLKVDLLNYPCLDQNQFECKPVLTYLSSGSLLSLLYNHPFLYTYVFHGKNLMKYTSFLYIINESSTLEQRISLAIRDRVALRIDPLIDSHS